MEINEKENLKNNKTEKVLNDALISLLQYKRFENITVKDICEEVLSSRATFYAHFADKYALLKYLFIHLKPENINRDNIIEQINELVYKNKTTISNILYNANNEVLDILSEVILSTLNLTAEKNSDGKAYAKYIVLSNMYAGGLVYYILWQVKNNFSSEIPPMNIYLYKIIEIFQSLK